MIELGKKAKDKISGLEGTIICRAQYLTGCDRYGVQAPAKDGKLEEIQWLDEDRFEVIDEPV